MTAHATSVSVSHLEQRRQSCLLTLWLGFPVDEYNSQICHVYEDVGYALSAHFLTSLLTHHHQCRRSGRCQFHSCSPWLHRHAPLRTERGHAYHCPVTLHFPVQSCGPRRIHHLACHPKRRREMVHHSPQEVRAYAPVDLNVIHHTSSPTPLVGMGDLDPEWEHLNGTERSSAPNETGGRTAKRARIGFNPPPLFESPS